MRAKDVIKFLKAKDYIFLQDIGQGGTGNTKLIRDETIDENFICKKYSPFNPTDKALYYCNFVEEIKILYKINHPNIVRVFNYYLYPEQTTGFILMEYIDGLDIDKYILANPDSINDVFIQTITGFKYLEDKMILHRDIRFSNILISNEGIVKIIDFGFGKNVESFEDYGKSITLNWSYSLPNEFEKSIYDFRTEVYFVGKLFERIINMNRDAAQTFKYSTLLSEMIAIDYNNRASSFFNVSRKITATDSLDIKFEANEKKIYSEMAQALTYVCASMDCSAKYVINPEEIKNGLENLCQKSILEEFIQQNNLLVSCFITPPYRCIRRNDILVSTAFEFKQWFENLSENKQRIVLNNLWTRFDNINRTNKDDELPF